MIKAPAYREFLKGHFDFLIAAAVIGAFVTIAIQRFDTFPLPQTDEAYILQVPYEMLNRGQLSWPMYRYLGGNIENVWHTFTPLFFLILSAFFKVFGWGLAQGRVFMVVSAVLVLLMVHLIGRRLFNWRVGLIAISMLIGDQTFFERSRLLRYDFVAAFFAMLAFYLFDKAEEEKRSRYYIASGLAVGAGIMCHPNVLYMLGGLGLVMLFEQGWRLVRQKKLYQFAVSALAVMSYVIIYDIIDYKNFLLQHRDDKLHFGILKPWGFWDNLVGEARRYEKWLEGGEMFLNVPRTTLWIFQLLTVAAIIYLTAYTAVRIKRGDWASNRAVRVFIVILVAALFHALIISHKNIYYMAHLTPWFALGVGIMFNAVLNLIGRLRQSRLPRADLLHRVATFAIVLAVVAFVLQLARQNRRYLREARNPELVQFEEIKTVLRSVVPEGVCPVAIKSPVMWLAFPEHDRCFATIEKRMTDSLDLDGNEYAVLVPYAFDNTRAQDTKDLDERYPLIGELRNTRFGTIRVYYTGTNPELRAREPVTHYFFGQWRGHVSVEQVTQAREVWSAGSGELRNESSLDDSAVNADVVAVEPQQQPIRRGQLVELCTIDLKPDRTYHLVLDATARSGRWNLVVVNEDTGARIHDERIGEPEGPERLDGVFRTVNTNRVTLAVQPIGSNHQSLSVSRMGLREVALAH